VAKPDGSKVEALRPASTSFDGTDQPGHLTRVVGGHGWRAPRFAFRRQPRPARRARPSPLSLETLEQFGCRLANQKCPVTSITSNCGKMQKHRSSRGRQEALAIPGTGGPSEILLIEDLACRPIAAKRETTTLEATFDMSTELRQALDKGGAPGSGGLRLWRGPGSVLAGLVDPGALASTWPRSRPPGYEWLTGQERLVSLGDAGRGPPASFAPLFASRAARDPRGGWARRIEARHPRSRRGAAGGRRSRMSRIPPASLATLQTAVIRQALRTMGRRSDWNRGPFPALGRWRLSQLASTSRHCAF